MYIYMYISIIYIYIENQGLRHAAALVQVMRLGFDSNCEAGALIQPGGRTGVCAPFQARPFQGCSM